MKFQQLSENELVIQKSALPARLIGLVMVLSLGLIPFILKPGNEATSSGNPKIGAAIVVALAVVGLLVFLLSKSTSIVLRRGAQSEITKKNLLGRSHTDVFQTQNLRSVVHSTTTDIDHSSDGDTQRTRKGFVELRLTDGSAVELFSGSDNFNFNIFGLNSFRKAPLSKEAEKIAGFLGLPLEREGDLTAAEAVREIGNLFNKPNPNQTPGQLPDQTPVPGPSQQPINHAGLPIAQPGQSFQATPPNQKDTEK